MTCDHIKRVKVTNYTEVQTVGDPSNIEYVECGFSYESLSALDWFYKIGFVCLLCGERVGGRDDNSQ